MDIIDVAKKEIRIFESPSAGTSKELMEDLQRARVALKIISKHINSQRTIAKAIGDYYDCIKYYYESV